MNGLHLGRRRGVPYHRLGELDGDNPDEVLDGPEVFRVPGAERKIGGERRGCDEYAPLARREPYVRRRQWK